MDCGEIMPFLSQKETQINHLNIQDPDCIPLHYLLAKDILKELQQFRNEVISNLSECGTITSVKIIDKYDQLKQRVQLKYDSLNNLKDRVYLLFYEKALQAYQQKNETEGDYNLQRSLQYNATFPDAILLKLNILLAKKRFEECLSLLNTLYYEAEMDDEQEKQAIDFTDKFYNKLYHTGDSLVKIEHAAEALELFEILEVFCLDLPAAYCNDDYFHGILRSKSGIYESYIAIAKVAEKRANATIAEHFYQYAQDYLETNPYLEEYEPKGEVIGATEVIGVEEVKEKGEKEKGEEEVVSAVEVPITETLVAEAVEASVTETSVVSAVEAPVTETSVVEAVEVPVTETSVVETVEAPVTETSVAEIKLKYDNMVSQGLALCIREKFTESFKMFSDAKKLEECNCFETDFRVDLMLHELKKFGIK